MGSEGLERLNNRGIGEYRYRRMGEYRVEECVAGIVLCGGEGRRMGRSKALLPFGPETLLVRVVRRLGEALCTVIVVAAADQALPPLPDGTLVARDRRPGRGPLEGIAAGLRALEGREVAFVAACDLPLLVPAFVRRMVELSEGHDIAVPQVGGHAEPLAAVYRAGVLSQIEALLAAGRLRPAYLFDAVRTRFVSPQELADVDPQMTSLMNINTPEDYRRALARAGFAAEPSP